MAIADTIESMKTHLGEAYASLDEKGATIPENKNLENLSESILSISGGDISEYFNDIPISGNTGESQYSGWTNVIKKIPIKFKASNVSTNLMYALFQHCKSEIIELDRESFSNKQLNTMNNCFRFCKNVKSLDLSMLDISKVVAFQYTFDGCESLETLNVSGWDFSSSAYYTYMFRDCKSLVNVPAGIYIGGSATQVNYMFSGCTSLEHFSMTDERLNTSKTTQMSSFLYNCTSLKTADFSNFDFSKLSTSSGSTSYGFGCFLRGCTSLTSVSFPVQEQSSTVATMTEMFYQCTNLTEIDLSFLIAKPLRVERMFGGCTKLQRIDIRNLNLSNITNYKDNMLSSVPTTCKIYVKDSANKQWFNTYFPNYTNVIIAGEE